MSVNFTWIIAMRMLLAMTPLGASVVPATLALKEMESTAIVSLTLFLGKSAKKKIVSLHLHHMEHSTSVYRYQLLIFISWNGGGKI